MRATCESCRFWGHPGVEANPRGERECRIWARLRPPHQTCGQYVYLTVSHTTPMHLEPHEVAMVEAERERRQKRGSYWLSAEGRAELRELFDDPTEPIPVLLDALEAAEARLAPDPRVKAHCEFCPGIDEPHGPAAERQAARCA